ncbi:Alpha/Beta hydrolase fold [Lasallia pustulata]|uniref:Alpha/Beta hydrolase fold n=1 Tax=Lasallia pustulata TaxID=136370 RepID=A0A1W5CX01_9LECA|nr:Alpha/Beta hydrolase fold [Lasallia pustulata]
MDGSVPSTYVPIVPARRPLPVKESRRQPSLPPPANTATRVNIQAASTEVISSLISSLSVISSPAADHFNALPNLAFTRSTTSSPASYQPARPAVSRSRGYGHRSNPASPMHAGFGEEYGAYDSPPEPLVDSLLNPYDAAIAPVVRTSKHPSAHLTPTAPKRHSLRSYLRSGLRKSQISISTTLEEMGSLETLGVDPRPRHYSASIASLESRKRSLRRPRSLVLHPAQDQIREQCQVRARQAIERASAWDARLSGSGLGGASVSLPSSPLTYNKNTDEDASWNSPQASAPAVSSKNASWLSGCDAALHEVRPTPRGIGGRMAIPMRDSSMRHSHAKHPTHRKQSSHPPEEKMSPGRTESKGHQESALDAGAEVPKLPEDEVGEVTKRIVELKELKKKRDCPPTTDAVEPPLGADTPLSGANLGPMPLSRSPSRHPSILVESRAAQCDEPEPPEAALDQDKATALSPSVVQRHDRDGGAPISSTTRRIGTERVPGSPTATAHEAQPTPPQRSNSRLRRLVRPTGAAGAEENKRTFSKRFSQPLRVLEVDERPSSADSIDDAVEDYLSSPRLTQRIRHPQTGRVVSFSDVGDPTGSVVFCCVGMGLTRYITAFYDELAATLKLRLITPDRPGVGESEVYADGSDTPLSWPDDVLAICQQLKINRFSILAHSAGAIYALATALRMPQHIRGRVHLLAPWIPPSQLSVIGTHQESLPVNSLPYSQRFLRSLPTPLLKAANSNFLSVKSASVTTSLPRSPRRSKRRSVNQESPGPRGADVNVPTPVDGSWRNSTMSRSLQMTAGADSPITKIVFNPKDPNADLAAKAMAFSQEQEKARQATYDIRLTSAIWGLATKKANPAVDLLVCLERRQTIGFRYVDITRSVVIHHGSKDSRVPVENVKWLGKLMRRCEVRVLDGEGHGLMASAVVMGNVLVEMAQEWEDWQRVVQGKRA